MNRSGYSESKRRRNDLLCRISEFSSWKDTFKDELRSVSDEMEARIASTMRAHCLASLPNEILSIIFLRALDFTVDGNDHDWRTTLRIATVCRQFREVVLRDPVMWSSINMDIGCPDALSVFLLRSGFCSLSVHFASSYSHTMCTCAPFLVVACIYDSICPAREATNTFIDAVRGSVHRWDHISVSETHNGVVNGIIFSFLVHTQLSLPCLESAMIHLKEDFDYTKRAFLSDAPMLKHLRITWSSPFFTGLPISLVKLELEITILFTETRAFLVAFAALVNLEDLSLDLAHTDCADSHLTDTGMGAVSLESLKYFKLKYHPSDVVFMDLYQHLHFPNLCTLNIALAHLSPPEFRIVEETENRHRGSVLHQFMTSFFAKDKIFPLLKSMKLLINLCFNEDNPKKGDNSFSSLFCKNCPLLEQLALVLLNGACGEAFSAAHLPMLKTLRIEGCPFGTDVRSMLSRYGRSLLNCGNLDILEHVVIVSNLLKMNAEMFGLTSIPGLEDRVIL